MWGGPGPKGERSFVVQLLYINFILIFTLTKVIYGYGNVANSSAYEKTSLTRYPHSILGSALSRQPFLRVGNFYLLPPSCNIDILILLLLDLSVYSLSIDCHLSKLKIWFTIPLDNFKLSSLVLLLIYVFTDYVCNFKQYA